MVSQVGRLGLICKLKTDKPNVHFIYSTEFITYVLYTEYSVPFLCIVPAVKM